uniref:Uncharacterized protein n=1 Tax=Cucumis melo TaxID=3656 RepID=A0A9I9E5K9_CUCME
MGPRQRKEDQYQAQGGEDKMQNNELDSRMNPSKGREDDMNQDTLVLPPGSITRFRAKKP